MLRAATLCESSYDPGFKTTPGRYYRVNQFWLPGEIFGFVEFDANDAFVVFRGTDSQNNPGNWVFTNLQAYRTSFTVLDTDLENSARKDVQGGSYSLPLLGKVHQGFYRAASWLWYGTEPVLDLGGANAAAGRTRVWRELSLFVVPLVIGIVGGFLTRRRDLAYWGAIVGFFLLLAVIGFERGTWEGLLMRTKPNPPLGTPLVTLKRDLMKCSNVWFVGHSLGGAIALLNFVLYRNWCLNDSSRPDNARLITFGAPRVGDSTFHAEFEKHNGDRFWNVVAANDPVPETPPCSRARVHDVRISARGPIGALLAALSIPWRAYAALYLQRDAGKWNSEVLLGNERGPFQFAAHSIPNYVAMLNETADDDAFLPTCVS
jgi:hypothetical protein